jgi:hypothetical protein
MSISTRPTPPALRTALPSNWLQRNGSIIGKRTLRRNGCYREGT